VKCGGLQTTHRIRPNSADLFIARDLHMHSARKPTRRLVRVVEGHTCERLRYLATHCLEGCDEAGLTGSEPHQRLRPGAAINPDFPV
jgi:hypothetical protein